MRFPDAIVQDSPGRTDWKYVSASVKRTLYLVSDRTAMSNSNPVRPIGATSSESEPDESPRPRDERRSAPRVAPAALPTFTAHLVDGPGIEIVNVSKSGILTRSEARLMPGAMIGLRVLTADDSFVLFGRVVRSRLLSIAEGTPCYESALALSRDFPLLATSSHGSEIFEPQEQTARTDGSYPREIGRLNGAPIVLTVTAFSNEKHEDVLKAFDVKEN